MADADTKASVHYQDIPGPRDQTIPQAENLAKFLLLPALLLGSFLLTHWLVYAPGADWPLAARLAVAAGFGLVNCVFIIGLGVLAHEAVHRVLFRSPFWNELIGGIASAMMLTPFHANRQFHLTHHGQAHQPGRDPEGVMHNRPAWQALTLGSMIGLALQYRLYLHNAITRFREARFRHRALMDTACLAVAGLFYVALPLALGLDPLLTSGMTFLLFPLVFGFRALSDHYGLPAVTPRGERQRQVEDGTDWYGEVKPAEVTGWVVLTHPLLTWLWSHVNYHEVHHKYPWLSHQYLPRVFEQTREQVPYRVAHGYTRSLLSLFGKPYYAER